jgi:hypothetical protein
VQVKALQVETEQATITAQVAAVVLPQQEQTL